jgi:hypothetical protein
MYAIMQHILILKSVYGGACWQEFGRPAEVIAFEDEDHARWAYWAVCDGLPARWKKVAYGKARYEVPRDRLGVGLRLVRREGLRERELSRSEVYTESDDPARRKAFWPM